MSKPEQTIRLSETRKMLRRLAEVEVREHGEYLCIVDGKRMTDTKHTPTPWYLDSWHDDSWYPDGDLFADRIACEGYGVALLYGGKGASQSEEEGIANAELIVRAVNSYEAHERCVEALRALVGEWEAERFEWVENRDLAELIANGQPKTGGPMFDDARAALAALEGIE